MISHSQYKSPDHPESVIENYIYYYNHGRIKERLKSLTPL
ncbi:MAG: IS3 family transposase [Solobacterium sp.]|nr:IS3 family transposase [Solobacterium sp.]